MAYSWKSMATDRIAVIRSSIVNNFTNHVGVMIAPAHMSFLLSASYSSRRR